MMNVLAISRWFEPIREVRAGKRAVPIPTAAPLRVPSKLLA